MTTFMTITTIANALFLPIALYARDWLWAAVSLLGVIAGLPYVL